LVLPVFGIAAAPGALSPQIVINEVYYDHPGTDTGWEFVELFNRGSEAVDMDGYRLEFVDGLSGRARTLWECPAGVALSPGQRLLVSGENVPGGVYLLLGSLENGPDAVRLVSAAGIVDLVGYGECPYCEGAPAVDVEAGAGLSRKPDGCDSDLNEADFVPAPPTPGSPNFYEHDLGLSLKDPPLRCTGEPFEVEVFIENVGLEDLRGRVLVRLSAEGAGAVGSSGGEMALDIDLHPGEKTSASLDIPSAPSGVFLIEASVDSDFDENERNDMASARACSSPGCIVINEIMYRPTSGGSEWLELKCRAVEPVSLQGWHFADAAGALRLISDGELSIEPNGFLVLAQDVDAFHVDHPQCTAVVVGVAGGWPWLNDTGDDVRADIVELRDGEGTLVECIEYRDLVGDERGRSIERFSADVCSSFTGGLWHRSVAAHRSTPGSENATIVSTLVATPTIRIEPNPYHPARDGAVTITGAMAGGESGLLVRIFDLDGREVERLFGEQAGARVFSCTWNGRDRSGGEVRTGLYVCVVEYVWPGGGVCRREKRCVALYR
jgi:hypothetical protein